MMDRASESLDSFEHAVIELIRSVLQRQGIEADVGGDTDLFVDPLITSVSFAELLSLLELELDIDVPDHMLSTEHFRTPRIIARNFQPSR